MKLSCFGSILDAFWLFWSSYLARLEWEKLCWEEGLGKFRQQASDFHHGPTVGPWVSQICWESGNAEFREITTWIIWIIKIIEMLEFGSSGSEGRDWAMGFVQLSKLLISQGTNPTFGPNCSLLPEGRDRARGFRRFLTHLFTNFLWLNPQGTNPTFGPNCSHLELTGNLWKTQNLKYFEKQICDAAQFRTSQVLSKSLGSLIWKSEAWLKLIGIINDFQRICQEFAAVD